MRRVCTGSQLASPGTPSAASGTPGYFNPAAPGLGVIPTVPGPDWFNTAQEELAALVTAVGITLDTGGTANAQVLQGLKRLLGGNYTYLTANATLTADDLGYVVVNAAAGAVTLTLPPAAAISGIVAGSGVVNPPRLRVARDDSSAYAVSVQRAGSDGISLGSSNVASVAIPGPGAYDFFADGTATWIASRAGGGQLIAPPQIFTSSGTYTPSPGARLALVKAVGGGSAGGGAPVTASGQVAVGAGGSAGTYGEILVPCADISGLAVTIGAGGTGVVGTTGNPGGATTIGSVISVPGAPGGPSGVAGTNAITPPSQVLTTAVTATSGTVVRTAFGASGTMGVSLSGTPGYSGNGGGSPFGPGASGFAGGPTNGSGIAAQPNTGGGGAGGVCYSTNATGEAGGDGGSGLVEIWEFT